MIPEAISIDIAGMEDVSALHALVESAYRGESAKAGWTHEADLLHDNRIDRATLVATIADPDERLLVARVGDALVGCAQVTRKSPTHAYFGLFAVDPQRQAAGLGKRILAAAEREARNAFGVTVMEMTVIDLRTELIAYYQRRGYRMTGERRPFPAEVDPPLGFVVLEKRLEPVQAG
ncbi:MAG: N-acetyltransferase [Sphingomonadales bacterium]|nr:MAG: N-acetyltransferase [Sphingomonadales bacterium]TNF04804.1 MAG: N-acetyltransferase [Sphingomonadales bacterium]